MQKQEQMKIEPLKENYGLAYTQVQLAFVSLIIMGFYCIAVELDEIWEKGLWYGFNGPAFISIFVSSIGGLIVAAGELAVCHDIIIFLYKQLRVVISLFYMIYLISSIGLEISIFYVVFSCLLILLLGIM